MGRAADIALCGDRTDSVGVGILARMPRRLPHGVLSIADQMVASATTFATGAVIGRICSKEEFGFYTIGFSLVTLLMTVQASLIATPFMIRFPRLADDEARQFAGSSLAHQATFAGVTALATLVFGLCFSLRNAATGHIFVALGVALAFLLLRDYIRQTCFARLAYGRALALDIVLALLQFGGLAALYVANALHTWSAFLVLGLACLITAVHWHASTRGERIVSRAAAVADLMDSWSTGKWLLASGLVWSVSMNLYAWLVAGFHGAATAGAWAAALGVMTLINPLMLGVQNYLGPRIMHARASGLDNLRRVVIRSGAAFCCLLLAFTATMAFAGGTLVTTIYGAKYAGSGPLVVLLSLNAAVLTIGFAVSRGLFALECARIDFFVNFAALACFLVVGVALVRTAGPFGAALGQLAANTLATGIRVGAFARISRRAPGAVA